MKVCLEIRAAKGRMSQLDRELNRGPDSEDDLRAEGQP